MSVVSGATVAGGGSGQDLMQRAEAMRMSRSSVTLRQAVPSDAPRLALLWGDVLRRADPETQVGDVREILERAARTPDQRVVVAEQDEVLVGGVFLRVDTLTPLNLEPVVQAVSPHVFADFRGRGVGAALIEAAAAFADECGIAHVASASITTSRDANRFMARLGLRPQAVLRVGSVAGLRSRVAAQRPALSRPRARHIGQVLAARRSQRRRESTAENAAVVETG